MRVRVDRNPAFEREIQADPQFEAAMLATTVEAADAVKAAAAPFRHTGYFIRHVSAAGTRVKLADPFWHLIEFGSANNPIYAPVRRGITALGLRFETTPK